MRGGVCKQDGKDSEPAFLRKGQEANIVRQKNIEGVIRGNKDALVKNWKLVLNESFEVYIRYRKEKRKIKRLKCHDIALTISINMNSKILGRYIKIKKVIMCGASEYVQGSE